MGLVPIPRDASGSSSIKRMLASLAEMLNSVILLKEDGDGLGDWPVGSILGQTGRPDQARAFHGIGEMRPATTTPCRTWQFLIPDPAIVGVYVGEAILHGIDPPGPIPLTEVMAHVRAALVDPDGGWRAVAPPSWAARAAESKSDERMH